MTGAVHVVGAGLSGLAAALALAQAGRRVTVWEASPRAGGRCRSFADRQMAAVLDNGTHLALSGNRALSRFLALTGAGDRLQQVRPAALPFVDLAGGAAWRLRPGLALLLGAGNRPPGVSALAVLADVMRLLAADIAARRSTATVATALRRSSPAALARLWAPLTVSALNAAPEQAAAALLATVLRETLLRGESACRPLLPRVSLDHAYIEPAVTALQRYGVQLRFHTRVRGLALAGRRVTAINDVPIAADGDVIVAVPPWALRDVLPGLMPGLTLPPPGPTIVNIHYRVDGPGDHGALLPESLPMLGLIGGRVDWLFRRGRILSATISDADDLRNTGTADIAARAWADICRALPSLKQDAMPPFRVLKERRATFTADPAAQAQRPPCRSDIRNLFLAGDWVANGLPATMEGAIRAGFTAAQAVLQG